MSFKIKKIKVTKKNNDSKIKKSIPYIFGLFSIIVIFFVWFFTVKSIWNFSFNLNFNVSNLIPDLSYFTSNKESNNIKILLVWRWWWIHDWANLTDSIILMNLNFDKKIVTMLSIPRDFYVKYNTSRYWKINWIYAYALWLEKSNEASSMEYLKNKIAQITWEQIDYYVNIDFSWFKKIVDMIWWVEVEVPETLVDNLYPNEETDNYTTFILKKWTWTLDWDTALKYSRSRHSTSDFDRSIRQQKILSAIKKKLIEEWYFNSPWKIKEMYTTLSPYFTTDIWISAMLKLAKNFKNLKEWNEIISLNLNNSCFYWITACQVWWILYNPPLAEFWASVVIPRWASFNNLEKYSEVQRFSNIVFNYSEIFLDKQEINIFNSLKIPNQALNLASDLQQYWFSIPEKDSIWNTWEDIYDKTTIFYNNIWDKIKTLEALKLFIKWEYIEVSNPKYSKNVNTKFEIIIWKDFKNVSDFDWTKNE